MYSRQDWTLATMLMRPVRLFGGGDDMSREVVLTEERYGTVPRVFVKSGPTRW